MKSKNEIDLADYQNELAGRETGKERRFFTGEDCRSGDGQRRGKDAQDTATLTALQIAMQNADYAAAYQSFWDAYDQAQGALDEAILGNADELERLEAGAARLDDGTMIFMRPDGSAETRDGRIIPASALVGVTIPENATTADDYRAALRRAAELARIQTEILEPAAERASDPHSPMTRDELEAATEDLEEVERAIESAGRVAVSKEVTSTPNTEALLSLDDLGPAP